MIYKPYGQTGVTVSAVGFGGMRFADQDDVDGCASLVKAAYDAGITYFDTSIGYGKSESLFGAAFREMSRTRARKPFYVSTKTNKSRPDAIRRELETSLTQMGLDYIDFYHVWCILSPDALEKRVAAGAWKEFERLRDEGLIRNICLSTHMAGPDIAATLERYPFDGVLLGYSAMNFAYREAGIEGAAKLNRGVVVMNPLGGGLIPAHPDRFGFIKSRKDETVVEAAIRFLIDDPRISVALVGFSSIAQVQEAVKAVKGYRPIPATIRKRMRTHMAESFNTLCTSCGYCDHCPQGIPVPRLMDSYNHYVLTGKVKTAIGRLGGHWGITADHNNLEACTRCGLCEKTCTQKLPILDRMAFLRKHITTDWRTD